MKWFSPAEEIGECEEFEICKSGPIECEKHTLIFGEVYPDDKGEYKIEISNGLETITSSANFEGILLSHCDWPIFYQDKIQLNLKSQFV